MNQVLVSHDFSADCIPANIRSGKTIDGVDGLLSPGVSPPIGNFGTVPLDWVWGNYGNDYLASPGFGDTMYFEDVDNIYCVSLFQRTYNESSPYTYNTQGYMLTYEKSTGLLSYSRTIETSIQVSEPGTSKVGYYKTFEDVDNYYITHKNERGNLSYGYRSVANILTISKSDYTMSIVTSNQVYPTSGNDITYLMSLLPIGVTEYIYPTAPSTLAWYQRMDDGTNPKIYIPYIK